MDINLLSEYIEFSKSLNINAAAKDLYMSQSALSKHLSIIESEVGVQLIDRSGSFKLTEAGKAFLQASSRIMHTYGEALETCRRLARGLNRITVLKPCTIDASLEFVFSIYRNVQLQCPDIRMELLPMGSNGAVENLLLRRVDCATLHCCTPEQVENLEEKGIDLLPLFEDDVYAWVPSDHALAAKESIFIADLADIPIFAPASRVYMDLHGWITALCSIGGFRPLIVYRDVADMYELMNSSISDGVMLLTSEATMGDPTISLQNNMILKPIADAGVCNTVYLGSMCDNDNPALQTLIDNIKHNVYPEIESRGIRDLIERD